jgi:hypothetical protein
MVGSARHDPGTEIDHGPAGAALERSFTMKKKGKKDEAKGPKKGK